MNLHRKQKRIERKGTSCIFKWYISQKIKYQTTTKSEEKKKIQIELYKNLFRRRKTGQSRFCRWNYDFFPNSWKKLNRKLTFRLLYKNCIKTPELVVEGGTDQTGEHGNPPCINIGYGSRIVPRADSATY